MSELAAFLRSNVDRSRYYVLTSDLGVRTPAGIRYPDLLVDRKAGGGGHLSAAAPVLIAEVLSPSSLARDMVEKSTEYTALSDLQHYLVLAQNEPRAWLWSRKEDLWSGPEMVEGIDPLIYLGALGVTIPLEALHADLPAP